MSYAAAPAGFELVVWHHYGEGRAEDRSGFGNHGRIDGPVPAEGRIPGSGALAFDGLGDRVVVPPSPSLTGLNALRVSAWIWLEELGGRRTIVEGFGSFSFLLEPDGTLEGAIYNGYRWESVRSRTGLLPFEQWANVTYLYDGSDTSALYLNGERVGLKLQALGRVDPVGWPFGLNIGAWPDQDRRGFKGRIEQVKIWRLWSDHPGPV
ncbi:MAG TPA: LamG-like jellyroll fold domain-containing protein [Actinomycetota bacterium]|nr:LamG-like jellyroll fold domain-containing protein [Actinomycetota bacterium]